MAGALAACAIVPLLPLPAAAEIIPAAAMLRGIKISHAQCMAMPQALWVSSYGQSFCVRYYLSTAGGEGPRPVVFLSGDKLGPLNHKTHQFHDVAKIKDIDTAKLQATADAFSKNAGTTAIYLGRIGIDGTSGYHGDRKTLLELALMNAALNALKRRYHFEGFHLAGQSGGSLLIGGLIAERDDIACAVSGSGPLARLKPLRHPPSKPTDYFDASDGIPQIVKHRALRILVLTDHTDRQVIEARQTPFVLRLRQAGGRVDQFFGRGTGEVHHGMSRYAREAVAGCVHGASNAEIARHLARIQAQVIAAERKRDLRRDRGGEVSSESDAMPDHKHRHRHARPNSGDN
jgi:hypothetical protein